MSTLFLWADSCCSVLARVKLSLSMVVLRECVLFSRSYTCFVKFSARLLKTWFSVSLSLNANFIRWMSPSSDCRSSLNFVSWFSASSRFSCSWFFSSSSFISFNFNFSYFSCTANTSSAQLRWLMRWSRWLKQVTDKRWSRWLTSDERSTSPAVVVCQPQRHWAFVPVKSSCPSAVYVLERFDASLLLVTSLRAQHCVADLLLLL